MIAILSAVVNGAIVSAPLAALIWVGMRFLSPRTLSAAARYVIWWAVLAVTVALPLAFLPARTSGSIARLANAAPAERAVQLQPSPRTLSPATPMPSAIPKPQRFPLQIPAGSWTRWVSVVWALSAMLLLLRLAVSCALLSRRKSRARSIPVASPTPKWRKIRVAVSEEVCAPVAVGFLRPTILIPERLIRELDGAELDLIVLHEAAHFARWDDYALIVERLIEACFALHPIVRSIARQIDLEREIACDDRVVKATGRPMPYAACLTRVAEITGGVLAPCSVAAATRSGSHLTRRVEMLLDKTRRCGARWFKTRLACAFAVVSALAWMAGRAPVLLAFTNEPPQRKIQPVPVSPAPEIKTPPKPTPRLIAQAAVPQAPVTEPAAQVDAKFQIVVEDVIVNANGRSVKGLQQENFRIYEDGVEQQISYFATEDFPTSLGVVSMSPDGLTLAMQEELVQLQQAIPVRVEFIKAADAKLSFDANAAAAVDQMQQAPNRRKIVLMLEGQTPLGFQGVFTFTQAGVTVIAASAGISNEVQSVAGLIPRDSYVLGYTPTNRSATGKYHSVAVGLARTQGLPAMTIDYRSGYWSGYQANSTGGPCRLLPSLPPNSVCY